MSTYIATHAARPEGYRPRHRRSFLTAQRVGLTVLGAAAGLTLTGVGR